MRRSDELTRASETLKAIAHPLRLRILSTLCVRDEGVAAMAVKLRAKPSMVSQALAILRREGLVAVTRGNRTATYRLGQPSLRQLVGVIQATLASSAGPTSGRRLSRQT